VQSKGLDWILRYIHDDLKVWRIIAPRSHAEDKNPLALPKRGYDDQGNPLCLYGYRLSFNGHDYQRRDGKWVCRYHPQPDVTVDLSFPNGDIRLARDFRWTPPRGSCASAARATPRVAMPARPGEV
jgi:hypothetical protein